MVKDIMPAHYYHALSKVTKILSLRLDLENCLQDLVRHIDDVVAWDKVEITLFLPELDSFQFYAVESKLSEELVLRADSLIHRKGSALGWVYEHRQSLIRSDLRARLEYVEDYSYVKEGLNSMVTLPLLIGDRCLGTLNVGRIDAGNRAGDEIAFLEQIATLLGLLVNNELVHHQLEVSNTVSEDSGLHVSREKLEKPDAIGGMVGQSKGLKKVQSLAKSVAPTDSSVLITGETGTGKELLARYIHDQSPRRHRPFIAINCAGLPSGLVESELFGHERGAFTGADELKLGRFELANGGTLFLDEIGEMPQATQSKLLRVLQDGQVDRLGGKESIPVDVRIVAATNSDLKHAVSSGQFRMDLFYRLHVFPIALPPLRDRPTDISLLAQHFLDRVCAKFSLPCRRMSEQSLERLMAYSWPGNVRELQNVIQRAAILSDGSDLKVEHHHFCTLDSSSEVRSSAQNGGHTLRDVEKHKILEVLEQTNWRIDGPKGAAKLVGLNPSTLRSRLKKLGIQRQKDRAFSPLFFTSNYFSYDYLSTLLSLC
ncbi:MAG: sigma 54-interacting transcriptional regulator [Nitrospirales bacterium]|nr:sigma 54-interacting transcriptional regulator [Nitrospirales bacterium]